MDLLSVQWAKAVQVKKLFIIPLVSFTILLLLQLLPVPGIYLMMFGGAWWTGLALLVTLAAFAADALIGNIRRAWIAVPLFAFAAYYSLYLYQGWTIQQREAELKRQNPALLLQFDPARQSLVMDTEGGFIVSSFRVPIAYSGGAGSDPQNHVSHQLLPRDECDALQKDSLARVNKSGVFFRSAGKSVAIRNLCLLSFPDSPTGEIVEIRTKQQEVWKRKTTIEEGVYTLFHNGQKLGEYRTASIFRYPAFPFPIIGCGLNSGAPSWDCFATFKTSRYVLDTSPLAASDPSEQHPVAIMLGLARYTLDELNNFQSYGSNRASVDRARSEAQQVEDDTFEVLAELNGNSDTKLPWRFGYSLAVNHERLGKDGHLVVDTFLKLARSGQITNAKEVAVAVAALPDEIFRSRSEEIFGVIQSGQWWDWRPALYIRAADVGDKAQEKYKSDLTQGRVRGWLRFAPALAICRIGSADTELLSFLKRELSTSDPTRDRDYHQALFLALLALGERDYVQRELATRTPRNKRWYDEVMASATGSRPNNCMVAKWPVADFLGQQMRGPVT
jgi:hypothetical protein